MTPFTRTAVDGYDGIIELIRGRLDTLQISHKTVDHLVGWADGYLGKVVGDAQIKRLGIDGLLNVLQALALKIEVVECPELLQRMEHRYEECIVNKRVLHRVAPIGDKLISRAAAAMGRKGGSKSKRLGKHRQQLAAYARASALTPGRRAEIAVRAARARWAKIREQQRTAQPTTGVAT